MPDKSPTVEPLLVRPKQAFRMLGIGKTPGYEMLRAGVLERRPLRKGGRAVGVTMASIKRVAEGLPPPEPPRPRLARPRS